MGRSFRSWFFFTALFLFLLAAAIALPQLAGGLFGETEERITETVDGATARVQQVWAEYVP